MLLLVGAETDCGNPVGDYIGVGGRVGIHHFAKIVRKSTSQSGELGNEEREEGVERVVEEPIPAVRVLHLLTACGQRGN